MYKIDQDLMERILRIHSLLMENNHNGKITFKQKRVLLLRSVDTPFSKIQDIISAKYVGSVQSANDGGIVNIMSAIVDFMWIIDHPTIIGYLERLV